MTKTALTMLAVTSTLVLSGIVGASAATVTETYDFTATFPAGSPVTNWDGSFTITFDPTLSGVVGPLALDAFSSNLPASYNPFAFSQTNNEITVGDNCFSGGCAIIPGGFDSAELPFFVDASGVPSPIGAFLGNASTGEELFADLNPTMTLVTPATPLPAALPLFATGLGALGLLGWRRKRKARVSLLGVA